MKTQQRKGRIGSVQHEIELVNELQKLHNDGWKVINLRGLSPDGIAVKDGKVVAIEVLGADYRKGKGWRHSWTYKDKKERYSMFDDVIIKVFHRKKRY